MNTGFYPKLALSGIKKNSRLYTPYILTCTGMVLMYYIISALSMSPTVAALRGGSTIMAFLEFGSGVIAVFSLIFLFYTNSFLSRRRKKEFGLYNILGMGKLNIARILFWETVISGGGSIIAGGILGIAFSKFAELALINIMREDINFTLSVSWRSLLNAAGLFSIIFLLIFLNTLRHIHASKPIELLHSENTGEKPPKANWVIGILGAVILGAAYYIAVTIENPLEALVWFFIAVIMVIIGTYMLFIAGSVLFCRILQKRRRYYYNPRHFVSVSSMVYRMKRNGAGLASICILATMVLVMISATASLYFGEEDSLRSRYPKDINFEAQMENLEAMNDETIESMRAEAESICLKYGAIQQNLHDYRRASVAGMIKDGILETDVTAVNEFELMSFDNVYQLYFVPLSDYNRMMNENETLDKGQVLIYTVRRDYNEDFLKINSGKNFTVKRHLDSFIGSGSAAMNIIPSIFIIVQDLETDLEGLIGRTDQNGNDMMNLSWIYEFDTQLEPEQQSLLNQEIHERFRELQKSENNLGIRYSYSESLAENRDNFYGTFGGLFFLGILLSIVFIFAAVLIIYYKQVSEGYEDESRFEIMQKVGMTKKEIRKSINSQLLTVFFMPLITAGIHLCFAFPIIQKLLMMFSLNNIALFAWTTVISFALFAVLYTVVYKITSNAYFTIVSGAKEQ